jgi:hypothetical protein
MPPGVPAAEINLVALRDMCVSASPLVVRVEAGRLSVELTSDALAAILRLVDAVAQLLQPAWADAAAGLPPQPPGLQAAWMVQCGLECRLISDSSEPRPSYCISADVLQLCSISSLSGAQGASALFLAANDVGVASMAAACECQSVLATLPGIHIDRQGSSALELVHLCR